MNSYPETCMSTRMLPSANISIAVRTMRLGELVNSGLTQPNATEDSQNDRKTSMEMVPSSARSCRFQNDRAATGPGSAETRFSLVATAASMLDFSRHRQHAGALGFLLDQPPDALLERDECRMVLERQRALSRQLNRDDVLDAGGPRREHDDAVGEEHSLVDLVSHEQRGGLGAREDFQQFHLHEFARLRVERGERLVEQQELRLYRESARDIHALAHAAGELVRIVLGKASESDELDQRARALLALGLGEPALQVEAVGHVLDDRAPWKQAVMLEHHGAVRSGPLDRAAVEQDRAGRDRKETIDRVEEGRFAAARRPHDGDELALEHRKVDVAQDSQRSPGPLVQEVERDATHVQLRSGRRLHRMPVSSPPATA